MCDKQAKMRKPRLFVVKSNEWKFQGGWEKPGLEKNRPEKTIKNPDNFSLVFSAFFTSLIFSSLERLDVIFVWKEQGHTLYSSYII